MSFRSALSNRGFRTLWTSQAISNLGDSVHEIALIWIVYEVTGNPALMSATVVASLLPMVLTSLPAGVFVDRWDRKRLLVGTTFLRGIAVLCIPLVGRYRPTYLVPTVIGVAFATGVLQAFFGPTKTAVVPELVPESDLDSANSLSELTRSLSRFLYALGGVLVAYFGSYVAFYVDAASFLLAGALLTTLPGTVRHRADPGEASDGPWSLLAEVREGLAFIRSSPLMRNLILLSVLIGFALGPLGIVLPVFAGRSLQAGSATFGYLYASIYVGAFGGGIVVEVFDEVVGAFRGKVIVAGVVGMGTALLSLTVARTVGTRPVLVGVVGMGVFGVCLAVVQIPVRTLAQTLVPDDVQGRVFSVWTAVGLVSPPLSVAAAGLALVRFDAVAVLLTQGLVTVGAGVILAFTALFGVGRDGETNATEESMSG